MPANLEVRGGVFYYRGQIKGKLHRVSTGFKVGTRRSLELAKRRAAEIETDIRAEMRGYVKKPVPTFKSYMLTFLAAYYPGTEDAYNTPAGLMRRPVSRWPDRRLDQITPTDIQLYFREREQVAKPGTLQHERMLLKKMFQAAIDDGHLTVNPLRAVKPFRSEPKTRVMTRDEETALRQVLSDEWVRWLTVATTTGLRLGELMALRPCDVEGDWLTVRGETNKTRKARRVPLRPETKAALAEQRVVRAGDDTVPYFRFTKDAARKALQRACAKLEIPAIGPHDMRRTFATRCAEGGMWPKHLQTILGHSDITTTMRFYVHHEQQSLLDAIGRVEL